MKHPFLIMLLASSTVFSIEKPSLCKQVRQKLFGKYLITKARENNCPEVEGLLQDLRRYNSSAFLEQSPFAKIMTQNPKIEQIILGINRLKHSSPGNEVCFQRGIMFVKFGSEQEILSKMQKSLSLSTRTKYTFQQKSFWGYLRREIDLHKLTNPLFSAKSEYSELESAISKKPNISTESWLSNIASASIEVYTAKVYLYLKMLAFLRECENTVKPYSLEELLQIAEGEITAARSALAAAAEKDEATTD